ncbi:MAG: tetratricopeptide repeat protein [Leptospirales bacterium]
MSNATRSGSEVSRQPDHSEDEVLNRFLGQYREHFSRRSWKDCLEILDEGISLFPHSGKISVERGRVYEEMGDLEKAEACYWQSFQEPYKAVPDSFLALAQLKYLTGDRDKVLWFLEEGLSLFPDHTDLLRESGIQNGLQGRWWIALPRLQKAAHDRPENPQNVLAYGALIERLEIAELLPKLIPLYQDQANRDPSSIEFQTLYSRALELNNQPRKALKHVRALLKTNPHNPFLLKEVGRLLLNINEYTRAVDSLRMSIEAGGESAEIHYLIALSYKMNGKPLAAMESARRAISLDPENTEFLMLQALLYIDMQEPEKASLALQSINSAYPFRGLGDLYLHKKQPDRAIAAYSNAFEKEPDLHTGNTLMTLLLKKKDWFLFFETMAWMEILFPEQIGRKFRSTAILKRWQEERDPTHSPQESLAIRGLSLYFSGKITQAVPILEQAVLADPLSEVLYWILGIAAEQEGKTDLAIEWYRRVLPSTREPVTLFHSMVRAHLRAGGSFSDLEKIHHEFRTHYSSRPGFYRVMHEWSIRSENRQRASEILREAMTEHPEDPSLYTLFRRYHPDLAETP